MPRRIQLQNHQDESKTLYIEHPFSLNKCMCIDSEDDDCIFYSVGTDPGLTWPPAQSARLRWEPQT